MHMVVTSDETQIQTVADWSMSHAKRVKRDNRQNLEYHIVVAIRSIHTRGIVPSCELATFAFKSSRRGQLYSLRRVPQNASCELFVGQVPGPQSLGQNS